MPVLVEPFVLGRVERDDQVAVAHVVTMSGLQPGEADEVLKLTRDRALGQHQMRILAELRQRQPQRAQARERIRVRRDVADERDVMPRPNRLANLGRNGG